MTGGSRFDVGIAHLHRYVAVHGTSNARALDTIDGFPIGRWVNSRRTEYRTGTLSTERAQLIEAEFPDWQWKMNARTTFDDGIAHLRRYVELHGTSNARQRDAIDGFPIGTWVASRRAQYRAGRLPADRAAQLEDKFPDWQWEIRTRTTFDEAITHLHRYVELHGTSNAPRTATIDGFPIGTWVAKRRTEYRRRSLPAERVQRLEDEFPDWQWTIRSQYQLHE
ncbi:helicase associated domain-containing protein (plasmid) [Gordonia hongkongensis]|uniref:helicase associated domain-containing protein n=1 Tax=Gordonia hongkongensis TaxID=1701090 RepID=UPI001FB5DEF8|nr:helicase associated domain-containing protein [Gordonia amicalis]UOG23815.1 helicase associated domain-containing protein [Gordonia amicalis]